MKEMNRSVGSVLAAGPQGPRRWGFLDSAVMGRHKPSSEFYSVYSISLF
jgi:hypothetical protein